MERIINVKYETLIRRNDRQWTSFVLMTFLIMWKMFSKILINAKNHERFQF